MAFYAGAARLLTKLADGSAKTYLKTLVLKAILETNISNFQKNTIKVLEPQQIFLGVEYKTLGNRMAENGVVFLGGVKEGKYAESYAAMYKGVVIEEFSKAEMQKFYKKWSKLKGAEMEEALEQSAKRGIKKIGAVEYEMLSPSLLTKYTQDMVDLCRKKGISLEIKWIDETHPRFNEPDYMGGFRITESKNKVILSLRSECPKITLYHERWHLEDFLEMGWKRYTDISKKASWLHEEAVWKRVYQNRNKWSELETVDAYLYYKRYCVRRKAVPTLNKEIEKLIPKYQHLIK